MNDSARERAQHPVGNRRVFWISVAIGWGLIGFGITGMLANAASTRPAQWTAWFVGAAVAHDLVIAPLVFFVAARMLRRIRPPYRRPVQAGLVLTGVVAISTFPFFLRLGARPDNPTVLPNDYATGLAIVVGGIWALTALVLARAWIRSRIHTR